MVYGVWRMAYGVWRMVIGEWCNGNRDLCASEGFQFGHGGEIHRRYATPLTTSAGAVIGDDENSLKANELGPTLLEDFILRDKIQHFDHERIPERVVHARGSGAHGYFQLYRSLSSI